MYFDIDKMTYDCERTEMKDDNKPYHHGDLRGALITAAEHELDAAGIEGFSLRKVAKRAGVSHAAPAHHFGDANGLLTALAAHGFRRFLAFMEARKHEASANANGTVLAGLGYIDFATQHTALFRLIFASERPDLDDPDLKAAAEAAYMHLCDLVEVEVGASPFRDAKAMRDASAVWAIAHGLADLLSSGRLLYVRDLPEAEREAALADILGRVLDG